MKRLRGSLAIFLSAIAVSSVVTGTLFAVLGSQPLAKVSNRTLTFAERVAYQRAIEEVYWRHRIWPKENLNPKPLLDAMVTPAQIEKKVADYLRKSQALENYWQRPLTAGELQAEMDRMARHTKQPEVLRDLFDALGNDPAVIAECLARPILTERLLDDLSAQDKTIRRESARSKDSGAMAMATTLGNGGYTLPIILEGDPPCIDDTWTSTTTTNAPSARASHTVVWTGSEMIVWGGFLSLNYLRTGGRYNPATDSWTATTTTNAPSARAGHTAMWTGSEMIVWGGYDGNNQLNSGARYNPVGDNWTGTTTTNAPSARAGHTAIWTGSEMIIWGGYGGSALNTGGRYNPSTNSWMATSTTNAPSARNNHTAVWTSSEMIVWGGGDSPNLLNTGGRYNPITNSWTATSTTSAPSARSAHTAVWTGSQMVVWGGQDINGSLTDTGGRYDPGTDTWTPTSVVAPAGRDFHTAVWSGSEMIVWGGFGILNGNLVAVNTGGRYNPGTNNWRATTTNNAPDARGHHTAVWTSSEMVVWGGNDAIQNYFNTGGRYCAQPPTPTPTPTSTATPTPTATATASSTATPTSTPRPTPTPRVAPTPRSRPTPAPRP